MSEFQVLRRPEQTTAPVVADDQDIASLFLGDDISESEKDIIATVFKHSDDQIDVVIPDSIKADDLVNHVVACTKVFSRIGRAQRKLVPVLGRLFMLVQHRRDVQEKFGCRNFTEFMDVAVPRAFRINRNDAYSCLRIVREFPQITVNTFDGLTIAKLKAISRAIPFNNGIISERQIKMRDELVESAKEYTYEDLVCKMHDMGLVDKEDIMPSKILVKTNQTTKEKWEKFISDPRVHSYVGSTNESAIVDAMISECYITWMAVAQANLE